MSDAMRSALQRFRACTDEATAGSYMEARQLAGPNSNTRLLHEPAAIHDEEQS